MANLYGTAGVDYCGYCKSDYDEKGECNCNGFGHAKGSIGTCGYCGADYFIAPGTDCDCDGFGKEMTITTLSDLHAYLAGLPDGTTCNIVASDLEAGNFETAHFEHGGVGFDVEYSGPVAEGYVSPFETQPAEADL